MRQIGADTPWEGSYTMLITKSLVFRVVFEVIEGEVTVADNGQGYNISGRLGYSTDDPYAIRLQLKALDEVDFDRDEAWMFDRSILLTGRYADIVIGGADVRVHGDDIATCFHLSDWEDGLEDRVHIITFARPVHNFCNEIIKAVPPGTEDKFLDLDNEIASLLSR